MLEFPTDDAAGGNHEDALFEMSFHIPKENDRFGTGDESTSAAEVSTCSTSCKTILSCCPTACSSFQMSLQRLGPQIYDCYGQWQSSPHVYAKYSMHLLLVKFPVCFSPLYGTAVQLGVLFLVVKVIWAYIRM